MADYLTNLIAKSHEPTAGVRPRLTALFEPVVRSNLAADATPELQPVNDLLVENEAVRRVWPFMRPPATPPQPQPIWPVVMQPPAPPIRTQAPPVLDEAAEPPNSETADRPKARRRHRPRLNEASERDTPHIFEIEPAVTIHEPQAVQSTHSPSLLQSTKSEPHPQIVSEPPPPRVSRTAKRTFTESHDLPESHEVIPEERPIKKVKRIAKEKSAKPIEEFEYEQPTGPVRIEVPPRIRPRSVNVALKPESHQPGITNDVAPNNRIAELSLTSNSAPITGAGRRLALEPARSAAAEQIINVTIGHVEVRAISAPAARPAPDSARAAKLMTLDDYLRQRAHGGRR
jgi:hypothetical protein